MTQLQNLWPTQVISKDIGNQQLIDDALNIIFTEYNLNRPPADFQKDNIIEKAGMKDFKENIVLPAFDEWLKLTLNRSLKDFNKFKLKSWITGTGNGYNMVNHNHSGAHLSAVFYLFNDSPEHGGEIYFFDPRVNANRGYDAEFWGKLFAPQKYTAKPGSCVVFPSFLYHQVTPFTGNMRIAMPVDCFFI